MSPTKKTWKETLEEKVSRLLYTTLRDLGDDWMKLDTNLKSKFECVLKMHIRDKVEFQERETLEIDRRARSEAEKEIMERFARRSACPMRLWTAVELFPVRYLGSINDEIHRQAELHKKISHWRDPASRVEYLGQIVRQLTELVSKDTQIEDEFEIIWQRLKNIEYGLPTDETSSQCKNQQNLENELLSLYRAQNVSEARQKWHNQKTFWDSRENALNDADLETLKQLCSPPIHIFFNDVEEMKYCKDVMKIDHVFSEHVTKHYKICLWLLHKSWYPEVQCILKEIETKWPFKDRSQRIHLYCLGYSELYDIVSQMDKHGPGIQPPYGVVPKDKDYKEYMDHLTIKAGDTIGFVARTLYQLSQDRD